MKSLSGRKPYLLIDALVPFEHYYQIDSHSVCLCLVAERAAVSYDMPDRLPL